MDPFERVKAIAHRVNESNGRPIWPKIDEAMDRLSALVQEPFLRGNIAMEIQQRVIEPANLHDSQGDALAEIIGKIDEPQYAHWLKKLVVNTEIVNHLCATSEQRLRAGISAMQAATLMDQAVDIDNDEVYMRGHTRLIAIGMHLLADIEKDF